MRLLWLSPDLITSTILSEMCDIGSLEDEK